MKRGDLYRVDFEPSVAGEPARGRPTVVLTNDDANAFLPHVVVAPVTSNVSCSYPFDVMLAAGTCGLSEASRVQLNDLRGLNRSRLGPYLGSLTRQQLGDLDQRLKVHLGLGVLGSGSCNNGVVNRAGLRGTLNFTERWERWA